jgi:hypothetical protein
MNQHGTIEEMEKPWKQCFFKEYEIPFQSSLDLSRSSWSDIVLMIAKTFLSVLARFEQNA